MQAASLPSEVDLCQLIGRFKVEAARSVPPSGAPRTRCEGPPSRGSAGC